MADLPGHTPSHDPLLIVLAGPSGVGKDSLLRQLRDRGVSFHYTITATTRAPREGEQDGVHHLFVSEDAFRRMIDQGELLEWARVYDHYYGVPRAQVETALSQGKNVIVRTDVQGAATIRRAVPDAVLVFLAPTSIEDLERRLRGRGSDSPEVILRRLAAARQEMKRLEEFDYVVFNCEGELEAAVDRFQAILLAEDARVHRRRAHL